MSTWEAICRSARRVTWQDIAGALGIVVLAIITPALLAVIVPVVWP